MGKGAIMLGGLIALGGFILLVAFFPYTIIHGIILIAIGLAIAILWREEGTIEKRKDIPKSKQKTPKK